MRHVPAMQYYSTIKGRVRESQVFLRVLVIRIWGILVLLVPF
jgi:hypothetical protein